MARRLRARCHTCKVEPASMLAHLATATHREKAHVAADRRASGDIIGGDERATWARSMRLGTLDAEERELEARAMAGDADHEPYWLGVLIAAGMATPADPGDGTHVDTVEIPAPVAAPQPAPVDIATAAAALPSQPCPRCYRVDWQTAKGRDWHVANNPDCVRYVDRARHAYAA